MRQLERVLSRKASGQRVTGSAEGHLTVIEGVTSGERATDITHEQTWERLSVLADSCNPSSHDVEAGGFL